MEQSIREAQGVIGEVRHELGMVSANRHLAQQQHAHLNGQHEKLGGQIEQAIEAGRDELAQAAVARQLDIEAQLPVLEATLAELARQEGELQGYVAALLARKREMEGALADYRASRSAAAAATAAAPDQPGATPQPASGAQQRIDAASDAFDRVHRRQTGLSAAGRASSSLQQAAKLQQLDDLTREHQIAERLARIKAGRA